MGPLLDKDVFFSNAATEQARCIRLRERVYQRELSISDKSEFNSNVIPLERFLYDTMLTSSSP